MSDEALVEGKPDQALVEGLDGLSLFSKNLFSSLSSHSDNVFFSPIAVHAVLTMVYQGARRKTKDAIAAILLLPEPSAAAHCYKEIITNLDLIDSVEFNLANKIYVRKSHNVLPSFKYVVQKNFHAELEKVNFQKPYKAADILNSWFRRKTYNKINDLILPGSIDKNAQAILVSAVCLKGNWLSKFDPSKTKTEKFYLNDIETIDCQMMYRTEKYNDYMFKRDKDLDAKMLELPYSNDGPYALSLIVILPNQRNGLDHLEEKLKEVDLTNISDDMEDIPVYLKLPKFKLETTIDFKQALINLGLGIMFNDKADFSGILESKEFLCVSEVVQKAVIEVDEEGSNSPTTNNRRMSLYCKRTAPEDFHADHPFIIMVDARQGCTSNILFIGRVSKPTY